MRIFQIWMPTGNWTFWQIQSSYQHIFIGTSLRQGTLTVGSFSSTPVEINSFQDALPQTPFVDLDGDGRLDAIDPYSIEGGEISIARNINVAGTVGTNSFSAPLSFPTGTNYRSSSPGTSQIKVADLDLDGKPDILVHG